MSAPTPGLKLTNDLVFKLLFSSQLHLLSDLINAVLQLPSPITVVRVLNPDILPHHVSGKRVIMDILVRDANDVLFIIEMQVRHQEPWPERNVYYLARGLSEQLKVGQDYGRLKPVIGISLLAHELFTAHPEQAIWQLSLRDEQTPTVGFKEALQLHIIELRKAERLGGLPPELSAWIACLLHNLDEAAMNQITHPPVQEALKHLEDLSSDEEVRWAVLQHEIAMLDEQTAINRATRQSALETLQKMLQHKFGATPAWVQDRLVAADFPTLQQWTLNILDASSVEDVFRQG